MKALFIGGTGTISSAITRLVAQTPGWQLQVPDPKFDAWCDHLIEVMEQAKESLLQ